MKSAELLRCGSGTMLTDHHMCRDFHWQVECTCFKPQRPFPGLAMVATCMEVAAQGPLLQDDLNDLTIFALH